MKSSDWRTLRFVIICELSLFAWGIPGVGECRGFPGQITEGFFNQNSGNIISLNFCAVLYLVASTMAERDEDYIEELEETEQERGVRKSKVHSHCTIIRKVGYDGTKADVRITNKKLKAVQACNNAL